MEAPVRLLPRYDELLIGYKDRGPSYETYGPVPISTHNGMFFSTAVEDGQVVNGDGGHRFLLGVTCANSG